MKRIRNVVAAVITVVFGLSIAFSGNTAYARKGIAVPTPVVSGLGSSYMTGSKINLKLTATGTTKLVQYKAVLTNNTTKKSIDLLKGYTPKYYNPKAGFPLSFSVSEGGRYSLSISAKPGGYKTSYSKTITKTFTAISNSDVIQSIAPVSEKVNIGEKYELPSSIEAVMKDGSTKSVDVKWDNTDVKTDAIGVKTYYGSVLGYKGSVMLTLNVVDEKIVSIDDINASVDEGGQYRLPEKITAKLNNGTTEVNVKWSTTELDTSKPGTYKFKGVVSGYNGEINLTLVVNAVSLKVVGVNNSNLREITVMFNKKLDKSTIRDGKIKVFKGTAQIPVSAKLSTDEKGVVLSITTSNSSFENQREYTLDIENIRDLNGGIVEKYNSKVTVKDVEIPKVSNVYITGPKTIDIEFSEPIKLTGTGKIELKNKNNRISISNSFSGYDTNVIRVTALGPMTVTAMYNLTISGFKDYAGHENILKTHEFQYYDDKTPISAELKYADEKSVMLEFNKEVKGITKEHFYNNVPGHTAVGVYKDSALTKSLSSLETVKSVWVKFYDTGSSKGYPFTDVEQRLVINGKVSNNNKLVDNWGNLFGSQTIPVKVEVDRRAPSIISMESDSESSIAVEFDEDVKFIKTNVEIVDGKGDKINNFSVSQISGTKYRINLGKNYANNTLTLSIKDVEDRSINSNKINKVLRTVEVKDRTAPNVEKVIKKLVADSDESLYIYFSEEIDSSRIGYTGFFLQSPKTYIMTKLAGKPEFTDKGNIVKIPVTYEEKNNINSGYSLFVSNAYDKSGNVLQGQVIPYTNILNYNAAENKPSIEKIEAVDSETLVVTFNQYLLVVDESAFLINNAYPAGMDITTNDEGNTVVTLKVQEGREDLSSSTILSIKTSSNKRIENEFGLNFDGGYYTSSTKPKIEDKVAPQVKVVSDEPQVKTIANSTGYVDAIVIEYTENIDMTRLSALSYSVPGRTIARVYTNNYPQKGSSTLGRYVIIELKYESSNTSGNISVRQVLDIYDMSGNKLLPDGSDYTSIDKTAPTVIQKLTSQILKGDTRTIKFSEDLNPSSRAAVEEAIVQASREKGNLVFNWNDSGVLSITNTSINETTNFNLSYPVRVTIMDNYDNITYNALIIGW